MTGPFARWDPIADEVCVYLIPDAQRAGSIFLDNGWVADLGVRP